MPTFEEVVRIREHELTKTFRYMSEICFVKELLKREDAQSCSMPMHATVRDGQSLIEAKKEWTNQLIDIVEEHIDNIFGYIICNGNALTNLVVNEEYNQIHNIDSSVRGIYTTKVEDKVLEVITSPILDSDKILICDVNFDKVVKIELY